MGGRALRRKFFGGSFSRRSLKRASAEKSAQKSAGRSAEKSAQKSAQKSAEKGAERSAENSAEKSAQKSAEKEGAMGKGFRELFKNRTAKILLLSLAAFLLLLSVWLVFFGGGKKEERKSSYTPTEREARLCRLLEEVEGVGDVSAMICEEDGVPTGAIVVFGGADSILSRMRILDITARALNLNKNCIQVYPAEKQS